MAPYSDYRKQIREARLANDITISEMARRTGIPRWQYQKFEEGAQVGTARLEAIVAAIPNLPPLHFAGATLTTAKPDLAEIHATARALVAAADHFQALVRQLQEVVEEKMASEDDVVAKLTAEEYRLRREEDAAERKQPAPPRPQPPRSAAKSTVRGREKRVRITPR